MKKRIEFQFTGEALNNKSELTPEFFKDSKYKRSRYEGYKTLPRREEFETEDEFRLVKRCYYRYWDNFDNLLYAFNVAMRNDPNIVCIGKNGSGTYKRYAYKLKLPVTLRMDDDIEGNSEFLYGIDFLESFYSWWLDISKNVYDEVDDPDPDEDEDEDEDYGYDPDAYDFGPDLSKRHGEFRITEHEQKVRFYLRYRLKEYTYDDNTTRYMSSDYNATFPPAQEGELQSFHKHYHIYAVDKK